MAHSADPVRDGVLFVHAHPDDEVISTGGTLALMAQNGTDVTVLTCTRGERGEVIPAALKHLEGDGPALAEYRAQVELPAALRALGIERHLFLGDAGARGPGLPVRHYTDSGMIEGADGRPRLGPDVAAHALCTAPFDEVVADIVAAIAESEAQAVVSYDEFGGYGHPDHLLAHRASRVAAAIARVPFHVIVEDPRELSRLEAAGEPAPGLTLLDVEPVLAAKLAALRAHGTQVQVADEPGTRPQFALSNNRWREVSTREAFRLLDDPASETPAAAADTDAPDVDDPAPATRSSRVASALVSLIVGVLVGVLLTINHQQRFTLGTVTVPIGVIVGLVVFTAIVVGMRLVFTTRLYALLTAVGVALASALLSQEGPGGSVLVPANLEGFVWAYAPLVIGAVVLAWPKLYSSRRDRMESQPRQEGSPL